MTDMAGAMAAKACDGAERAPPTAAQVNILRHASELFTHYGFNKTSMGDIAERCDMSPANLYNHYRNKEAIGLAAVELHFRHEEAAMEAAMLNVREHGAAEMLRAVMRTGVGCLVEMMTAAPKIHELAEFFFTAEGGREVLDLHLDLKRGIIIRIIETGQEEGAFRVTPPREAAVSILLATKAFWVPTSLAHWRDKTTILPELDQVLDLCVAALEAR